jgi:hypothetical protein
MYLALTDLESLFENNRGIKDDLMFVSVSDQASKPMPKGLFVALNENSGELSEALSNGAIAAICNHDDKVPSYTPNHFPIFFTDDPAEAMLIILKRYIDKLNGEKDKIMEITTFKFSNKELLNKNKETYDIAVMLNEVNSKLTNKPERRE